MKYGLSLFLSTLFFFSPLLSKPLDGIVRQFLDSYTPATQAQQTNHAQASETPPVKTKTRFQRWTKWTESILLCIALQLVVSKVIKEYELPAAQELSEQNKELGKIIEKKNQQIDDVLTMYIEITTKMKTDMTALKTRTYDLERKTKSADESVKS